MCRCRMGDRVASRFARPALTAADFGLCRDSVESRMARSRWCSHCEMHRFNVHLSEENQGLTDHDIGLRIKLAPRPLIARVRYPSLDEIPHAPIHSPLLPDALKHVLWDGRPYWLVAGGGVDAGQAKVRYGCLQPTVEWFGGRRLGVLLNVHGFDQDLTFVKVPVLAETMLSESGPVIPRRGNCDSPQIDPALLPARSHGPPATTRRAPASTPSSLRI